MLTDSEWLKGKWRIRKDDGLIDAIDFGVKSKIVFRFDPVRFRVEICERYRCVRWNLFEAFLLLGGAEVLARRFHEVYERLAPSFGCTTREESRVEWDNVPENNRQLMIAVCQEILSPS